MKEKRKKSSILMLLIILGNFFIGCITPVKALTTGAVYDYITSINTLITNVEEKIALSEANPLYLTDNSFKEAVIYIKDDVATIKGNVVAVEETLDNKVSLSSLIANKFSSKQTIYDTYFLSDTTVIDVNDIKDITYIYYDESDPSTPITGVLLTKEEIETAIKEFYLETYYDEINNYNTNYDSTITINIHAYNTKLNLINNYKSLLTDEKNDIVLFEQAELALNNVPNMNISDVSIYTIIDEAIANIESEKDSLSLKNASTRANNASNIYDDAMVDINSFLDNNKTYIKLDLDDSIISFNTKINDIEKALNSEFVDINDFKNDNYAKFSINVLTTLKNIIQLESEYNTLKSNVDDYLERRPSDTTSINALMENIIDKRNYINKENAISDVKGMIDYAPIKIDEDVVDSFSEVHNMVDIDDSYKEKLLNAKLGFYPISLTNSTNYQIKFVDDYLVINNLKSLLSTQELLDNTTIPAGYKEVSTSATNVNHINFKIKDKNNILIKEYQIVVKGDINDDGFVDSNDIALLKKKILDNEDLSNKIIMDINEDDEVNVKDLVLLNNIVNNITPTGITTNAKFNITKNTLNDLICYDISLETDGNVVGFKFDTFTTDNLIFDSIINDSLLEVNDLTNPSRFITLDTFTNEKVVTLCYKEDITKDLTTETFRLSNIEIIYDNGIVKEIDETILTSVKVENEERNNSNNNTIRRTSSTYIEEEKEVEPIKEEIEKKVVEEEHQEVLWSNVIKIIVIVLLGAVIIYFLNKNETEDDILEEKKETKKDSK